MAKQINVQGGDAVRRNRKVAARQALAEYDSALTDLTDNWSSLSASAKSNALRHMVILMARILRYLVIKTQI